MWNKKKEDLLIITKKTSDPNHKNTDEKITYQDGA